jgi:hypothetical protein
LKLIRHVTLGLCLIYSAAALSEGQATAPATRPSTKPATQPRTLIKVSQPAADGVSEPLVVLLDVNDAPDLKDWALTAANYAIKWHPEIEKMLPSEGYTAPRRVTIVFRTMNGVAYTQGQTITISSAYAKKHQDDLGMVAHELTHVIQHYSRGDKPGWLVEGIADYIRYYKVEPGTKRAGFNPARGYKGGYNPAAALLNWLEKEKPGIVVKLNTMMREGTYSGEKFEALAGGTPDEVWEKFKDTLKKS